MADVVERAEAPQAAPQVQQQNPHAGALRAYLTGSARVRPEIVQAMKSLHGLFSGLVEDKLLVVKAVRPTVLHVSPRLGPTIRVKGVARRQGTSIVPCVIFSVVDREVPVKMILAPNHTTWTWAESAGLGVSGQSVDADTTCRVFLALLAGEV
jgi:hypothetical protein